MTRRELITAINEVTKAMRGRSILTRDDVQKLLVERKLVAEPAADAKEHTRKLYGDRNEALLDAACALIKQEPLGDFLVAFERLCDLEERCGTSYNFDLEAQSRWPR
jgi:hypothetical protein